MQLSDEGLRLIKSFEGYHTRLPDGGCAAYLCPANVPTIGYGVTEGVKLGMVWTEQQAEEALRAEIRKHEAAVTRLATVDLNQNEFDALVSFSYNCGAGALGKSTLLKKLNKGDRLGAAKQFSKWTRGGGRVLGGLVSRREREAALFLKPVEAPEAPYMPQQVGKVVEITPTQAVGGGLAVGGTVAQTADKVSGFTFPDLTQLQLIRDFAMTGSDLLSWFSNNIILAILCGAVAGVFTFLPQITERLPPWLRSSSSS